MDHTLLIYTILAIILVVTIVLVIMWSLSIQTVPTYATAPQYTKAGFGSRCSVTQPATGENSPDQFQPQTCDTGLVCISATPGNTGFCIKDLGTACSTIFECVPEAIVCNGFCSSTGRSGLNVTCSTTANCDLGLVCDTSLLVCKEDVGSSCVTSADCATDTFCAATAAAVNSSSGTNTVCQNKAALNQPCIFISGESTCVQGYDCSTSNPNPTVPTTVIYPHFCQPPNIATGTIGALCYLWKQPDAPPVTDGGLYEFISSPTEVGSFIPVPICNSNLQCNFVRDLDGLADNPSLPGYGTCAGISTWNGPCDTNSGCQTPQVCIQNTCGFPITTNDVNIPLSCDNVHTTGVCLRDFICSTNNTNCLGVENENIPATDPSQCQFGNLSSTRQIVYQFFQNDVAISPTRLSDSSWTNLNIVLPPVLDTIESRNITITSFEANTNVINVSLHPFETNSFFICTTTGFTEHILSSNVVGTFQTNVSYVGTSGGNPDFGATVPVSYIGVADYIGYTGAGNYYAVIRYTLQLPVVFPSPPFGGFPPPLLTDFSRIYYDTDPTFATNQLTADSFTGLFVYTSYEENTTSRNVKYIYSASVDDRVISSNAKSVRFFIVARAMDDDTANPPISAINETFVSASETILQQNGALITADLTVDFSGSEPLLYYAFPFQLISFSMTSITAPDYTITWCMGYIYRTMETNNAKYYAFAKSNDPTFTNKAVRIYFPFGGNGIFRTYFPINIDESKIVNYITNIGVFSTKLYDITKFSIAYVVLPPGGTPYLGGTRLNGDFALPAYVDGDTRVTVPFANPSLDVFGYTPRLLLLTNVCGV
jgi:hypothetical protein